MYIYRKYTALIFLLSIISVNANSQAKEKWFDNFDYSQVGAQVMSRPGEAPLLRGRAIRLDHQGRKISAFYDVGSMNLRYVTFGGVQFKGTPWDGSHGGHSNISGDLFLSSGTSLAWTHKRSWSDPRAFDYAPLPKQYLNFKGSYRHNEKVVLNYKVGNEKIEVLEMPSVEIIGKDVIFVRHFKVLPSKKKAKLKVYENNEQPAEKDIFLYSSKFEVKKDKHGIHYVQIPASDKPQSFYIRYSRTNADVDIAEYDLSDFTGGGNLRWPETVTLQGKLKSDENSSFVVDQIPLPFKNPYDSVIRFGGFDFFDDGTSAAFCTWNGDVWIASGLDESLENVTWKRFAAGINEALGIRIVDGKIHVTGKDQITRLHDINGDGEADYYENFNNDIKITSNFHEFTFGLQTDAKGNFYITKASPVQRGGRGFDVTHDNHGTVFKISPDGRKSEIFYSGLRAPGGLAVNPEGTIVTTGENEGTYVPACKINYGKKDDFMGVLHPGNRKLAKQNYNKPLCFLPMDADNSGGGQVWVPSDAWGDLGGSLIHLSYGQSKAYTVLKENTTKSTQGGVIALPFKLMSSAMRARFNPVKRDEMYIVGFKGWQTNASLLSAVNRVTYKKKNFLRVTDLKSTTKGIYLKFNAPLEEKSALDLSNYSLERWNYLYSEQYGSAHFATNTSKEDLELYKQKESKRIGRVGIPSNRSGEFVYVTAVKLLEDKQTVFIKIIDMKPVDQMRIDYSIKTAAGQGITQRIYNTIYTLQDDDNNVPNMVTLDELKELEKRSSYDLGAQVQVQDAAGNKDTFKSRLLSLQLKQGEPITPFLNEGAFDAVYSGYLHVLEKDTVYFQARGNGALSFELNGNEVLNFKGSSQAAKTNTIELKAGFHPYTLRYAADTETIANFTVMWDGNKFPLSPINPYSLRFLSDGSIQKAEDLRKKRNLIADQRCFNCHTSDIALKMPELAKDSPSLEDIGSRLKKNWLSNWIANPQKLNAKSPMPRLVDNQGAAHIAAYLSSQKSKDYSDPLNGDISKGAGLFYDLGCIACHTRPKASRGKGERRSLNHLARKFQPQALKIFLLQPEKYYHWTKMPNFRLSDSQAENLASFLLSESSLGNNLKPLVALEGDAVVGKKLYESSYCGNCHEGKAQKKIPMQNLQQGCLSNHQPFGLNIENRVKWSLPGFFKENMASFGRVSTHEFAERQMKILNCQSCHSRDNKKAFWENYSSEISDLKKAHKDIGHLDQSRPQLTYAGAKLTQDTISGYLSGNLGYQTRDWLLAKMPSFPARAELLSEGLVLQHAKYKHTANIKLDADKVRIGEKLTGTDGGFACAICHDIGDQNAIAAFEVKGIDLKASAQRLTTEYFYQWMLNPLHFEPTTKMPKYIDDNGKSAMPDYDNSGELQVDSIYHYLKSLSQQ